MSKEKWRVPKLRFPGFTEDWEQRKLIYIFNDFIVPMRDKPKVFSGTTPWTRIEDIEGRYINTSLSGQFVSDETIKSMNLKVIPKGSLIVSASATFGVVAIVNNDLITNQTFIGLVPNKDFDIDFLYSLFEAPTTKGKLLKLSAGSTIFYIARESFENLVLSVPSKEEQIKISKVFKSIDDSITLHQRKLNNLKLKKKALLQKLFPKNGERYPELRFPGFTDAWEQRKFGELFILKSGVAFKLSEYTKTGIPIINGESIKAGKISLEKINYLPNEYQYKYQECLLFPGDIVLGLNRPIIDGTLKISRIPADIKKSLLYQRAGKIIFKVNMDENFTYQLLSKEVLTFTKKEAVGSDQPFITTTKLNKWDLYFPVKDKERRNIGSLFNNIDNIITLHQRKLDHLQLQKKALLQQMFV
ncbi:MAG: restriction endonuclease subunit S [Veillonella sp.]|uniref:restriction endonuclease subunit S n=2 Tax=Veillonella sp. TaxID=1926307 RepID=UPI00257F0616|nr:restriction endonuclease subunit S [Veillonella sp.]MBS5408379.1 restriction endonuclease subunit S [Veillonella sp.]